MEHINREFVMRIGLFGGTFNPPHNGHIRAAECARAQLELDRVVLVPASIPPHKPIPPGTPPPEIRLRLAQAAVKGHPWAEVSDIELTRSGVSYTADTLCSFTGSYARENLWLLVGSDNFLRMHEWYRPESVFAVCSVAVFAREPGTAQALREQQTALKERYGARIAVVALEPMVVSSTALRSKICRGEGTEYLPPGVAELIQIHGLYKSG
jgi:nicotinate-nucleotide adenylyltransferase